MKSLYRSHHAYPLDQYGLVGEDQVPNQVRCLYNALYALHWFVCSFCTSAAANNFLRKANKTLLKRIAYQESYNTSRILLIRVLDRFSSGSQGLGIDDLYATDKLTRLMVVDNLASAAQEYSISETSQQGLKWAGR